MERHQTHGMQGVYVLTKRNSGPDVLTVASHSLQHEAVCKCRLFFRAQPCCGAAHSPFRRGHHPPKENPLAARAGMSVPRLSPRRDGPRHSVRDYHPPSSFPEIPLSSRRRVDKLTSKQRDEVNKLKPLAAKVTAWASSLAGRVEHFFSM
jgi:hypothetical protein